MTGSLDGRAASRCGGQATIHLKGVAKGGDESGVELLGYRDEGDAVGIEQFNQLGEVRQRSRQAVDFVDNDDIDLPGPDIIQELLEVWPVGRPTGVSAIVIAGSDQGPSGMGLALDIGRGGIVLRTSELNSWSSPCSVETLV
jgi:hypothetical protein